MVAKLANYRVSTVNNQLGNNYIIVAACDGTQNVFVDDNLSSPTVEEITFAYGTELKRGGFIKAVVAVNRRICPPTAGCRYPSRAFDEYARQLFPIQLGKPFLRHLVQCADSFDAVNLGKYARQHRGLITASGTDFGRGTNSNGSVYAVCLNVAEDLSELTSTDTSCNKDSAFSRGGRNGP